MSLLALIPSASKLLGSINLPPIGNTSLADMIRQSTGGALTLEGGKWVSNLGPGMTTIGNKLGVGITPAKGSVAMQQAGLVIDTSKGTVTNPQPLPSWLLPVGLVVGLGLVAYAFLKRRRK